MKKLTSAYLIVVVLALAQAGAISHAQADSRYFAETKHNLQGKFLACWQAHGGLAQQRY